MKALPGNALGISDPGLIRFGIAASRAFLHQAADIGRLQAADIGGLVQEGTTCCYAKSDKTWVTDPQGIAWESFHTLGDAPTYNDNTNACCAPTPAGNSCC